MSIPYWNGAVDGKATQNSVCEWSSHPWCLGVGRRAAKGAQAGKATGPALLLTPSSSVLSLHLYLDYMYDFCKGFCGLKGLEKSLLYIKHDIVYGQHGWRSWSDWSKNRAKSYNTLFLPESSYTWLISLQQGDIGQKGLPGPPGPPGYGLQGIKVSEPDCTGVPSQSTKVMEKRHCGQYKIWLLWNEVNISLDIEIAYSS